MQKVSNTKTKLKQYRNYCEELDLLKQQVDELDDKLKRVNSTSIIGKPEEGGLRMYMNNYISDLADMKDEYERRYITSLRKFTEVRDLIDLLSDPLERKILYNYYCCEKKKTLYQISRELHYTPEYVRAKHTEALKKLEGLDRNI